MRTLRILAVALALAFAARADAAILTLVTDGVNYHPGTPITITLTGDSGGEADFWMVGRILFDPTMFTNPSVTLFTPQSGTPNGWLTGGGRCDVPGVCYMINHIVFPPDPTPMDPQVQTLAVFTATIGRTGVANVQWGDDLYFFGTRSDDLIAPNLSFVVLPEPSTTVLVGIGLIGLAIRRRRPN